MLHRSGEILKTHFGDSLDRAVAKYLQISVTLRTNNDKSFILALQIAKVFPDLSQNKIVFKRI